MTTAISYLDPRGRRPAALALTVLAHAVLLAGWLSRQAPPPDRGPEPKRTRIQWIRLPPPALPAPAQVPVPAPAPGTAGATQPARPATRPAAPAPARPAATPALPAPADTGTGTSTAQDDAPQPAPAPASPPMPPTPSAAAEAILQRARRDAGAIDRALRKENNPYIVAPLDSPQIRMRNKMQAAHDAVRPGMAEAPAIDEIPDASGALVTRVRGALGTYCMKARSPAEGIDAFEKGGGVRRTGCPTPSAQGGSQGWRTARD